MKNKLIFFAVLLALIGILYTGKVRAENFCAQHLYYGVPTLVENTIYDCKKGYAVSHSSVAKIPVWVGYILKPEHTLGCEARTNKFKADLSFPKGMRAETSDYRKSGYDIGHLANAADLSYSKETEEESFLLTNMSPQVPKFNRGIWKYLEGYIRDQSFENKRTVQIYVGNIWDNNSKTIGSGVIVPDKMYKIVIDTENNTGFGVIIPNAIIDGIPQIYITSIKQIELESGIIFPVGDLDKNKVWGMWPTPPFKTRLQIRKETCRK